MKNYIGTKSIKAKPMRLGLYYQMRGWGISSDEDPNIEGYMIRNTEGDIGWSPKKDFERSYREINGLTFGLAIELLKQGHRVARKGWNGKNMFIFIRPNDIISNEHIPNIKSLPDTVKRYYASLSNPTSEAFDIKFTSYICMKDADDSIVNGWLPSQIDILSEDWEIVQ